MVVNLSENNSIVNQYLAEIRSSEIQQDRLRFRTNMERIGFVLGYEWSKKMQYSVEECVTPLGVAEVQTPDEQPILITILRAGLPLHQGILNSFDHANCGYISAYRKHSKSGKFNIEIEYMSCPPLDDKHVILSDPMCATGSSAELAIKAILDYGTPKKISFLTVIASVEGIEHLQRTYPNVEIWTAAIDDEMTAKAYIVPGLGDAGDLAFGPKIQD